MSSPSLGMQRGIEVLPQKAMPFNYINKREF